MAPLTPRGGPRPRLSRLLRAAALGGLYLGAVVAAGWLTELYLAHRYGLRREALPTADYAVEDSVPAGLPRAFERQTLRLPGTDSDFVADYLLYGCRDIRGPGDGRRLAQGEMRTLFLGDSFTLGWGSRAWETFASLHASARGEVPTTLACGGYARGTAYHQAQLERVLRHEHHLRTLYYQLCTNDYLEDFPKAATSESPNQRGDRVAESWQSALRRRAGQEWMPQLARFAIIPAYRQLQSWLGQRRTIRSRREHVFGKYGTLLKRDSLTPALASLRDRLEARFVLSVSDVVATARAADISVVGFVIPDAAVVEPETAMTALIDLSEDSDAASVARSVDLARQAVERGGGVFVDLYPAFQREHRRRPDERLYLTGDLHLSASGNALVAKELSALEPAAAESNPESVSPSGRGAARSEAGPATRPGRR